MTDLATRIADVKLMAVATQAATTDFQKAWAGNAFREAASPDLVLAMAARIEELERSQRELKKALDTQKADMDRTVDYLAFKVASNTHSMSRRHLRTAAHAYRGEK